MPFIILFGAVLHIKEVHNQGSTEPLGRTNDNHTLSYTVGLLPTYLAKDLFMVAVTYYALYTVWVFNPDRLVHSINYIEANRLLTPEHIVPEWYLLPFYGILRSIDSKVGGSIARIRSIARLFLRPKLSGKTYIASAKFNMLKQRLIYLFASVFITLGYLGACKPIPAIALLGKICIFRYFTILLLVFVLDTVQQERHEKNLLT